MNLTIDLDAAEPVYRQISGGLRVLLVNGRLTPGDALPPVRQLALDLGVHFNTVAQAYRCLADEGWIAIGRRSGARVIARLVPEVGQSELANEFQRRLLGLIAEFRAEGYSPKRIARELERSAQQLKED